MKICYLSDAISVHTKKWCEFFVDKGYEIVVISLRNGEIPGVKVYGLGAEGYYNKGDIAKLNSYTKRIQEVKEIVAMEKPDIVHAHYATSYGILGSCLKFHPYFLSVWGTDIYTFPNKSFIHKKFLKYNLKKADFVLSTSKDMKREAEKYTKKEILVTPFGVPIDRFKPMKVDREDVFTVGTIKALIASYGLEYLIRGFKIFMEKSQDKKAKLLIAGKGEQEEELKNLAKELDIEENVHFLGFISEDEVIETFNKMDVAVFPSVHQESFGVAAVEAQACGIPAIVSDVGGLTEATKPGYSSLTVRPESSEDIGEAIYKLYKDKDLREEMKKNARQYILDNFNVVDNFNYVDGLYKKAINSEKVE